MKNDLDLLYQQARGAIASRDYERASDLLKKILAVDASYRDASRLLADLVARRRRLWYRDPRLWGAACVLTLAGLFFLAKDAFFGLIAAPALNVTPSMTQIGEVVEAPEVPTTPTSPPPTAIPLGWKRLYPGTEFSRSTVTVMAANPRDPSVLYVGTSGAGIFKSINRGVSWAPSQLGIGHASIDSLVIDPADPDTLYAGTSSGGIFKSSDGGTSWAEINDGIRLPEGTGPRRSIVLMDPEQSSHFLALVAGNLYETQTSGTSWQGLPDEAPDGLVLFAMHPLDSRTLFAVNEGPDSVLLKSQDGGRSWTMHELQEGFMAHPYDFLEGDKSTGKILYASGEVLDEEPPFDVGTYVTLDGGDTWARIGLEDSCTALGIHPEEPLSAICATKGGLLRKTIDGGQTWQELARPPAGRIHRVVFDAMDPETLWVGGLGLFISTDGGVSWEARSDGLGSARVELYLDPLDPAILYAEDFDAGRVFRSRDGGQNWDLMSDEGKWLAFDADGRTMYRSWEGGILVSPDRGETWTTIDMPLGMPEGIDAHPRREGRLFAYPYSPNVLAISDDRGESWEWAAGMRKLKNARLYFGHDPGQVVYAISEAGEWLYRSEDDGKNWVQCGSPDARYSDTGTRLAIDPRDSQRLFLATWGRGVLVSEDGCRSWTPRNQGLESQTVNSIAIDPHTPSTIYAGTDGGAFVSFDGGHSWGVINEGLLGATVIYSIVVDPLSNVYAATPYGIFRLEAK